MARCSGPVVSGEPRRHQNALGPIAANDREGGRSRSSMAQEPHGALVEGLEVSLSTTARRVARSRSKWNWLLRVESKEGFPE